MRRPSLKEFNIRIGDFSIQKANYTDITPEYIAYHIDKIEPNPYFQHEKDFEWSENGETAFVKNEDGTIRTGCCINKSCFKYPESKYAIATFQWNKNEEMYELKFCDGAPFELTEEEKEIFWKIAEIGYKTLNSALENL